MAARQLGYYHARIEGTEETRAEQMTNAGGNCEMPPMDSLERLWTLWDDAGRTTGLDPLAWHDIESFGRIADLSRDEMLIFRRMSLAYLEGLRLTHPLAREPMDQS